MNRFSRFIASALSLSLVLASAPYEAAAQVVSARVSVPGLSAGAAAGSINSLGGLNAALPAPSLSVGLVPALSPSAVLTPSFAPALVSPSLSAVAVKPIIAAAAAPAAVVAPAAAVAAPLQALTAGAASISAAVKSDAPGAPRAALDAVFEGASARPEALAVSVRSAASDSPRLDQPESRGPAQGPRWVNGFRPDGTKPATSLKRTLSVGFLAAVIPIAITMGAVVVAQLLGYELHPNYKGPAGTDTTSVLQALAIWVGAAVMAPVSEEAIFRGGIQGRLAKLSQKLRLGSFVVPALLTSVLFVSLHETSDPLLFSTRMVHAMILSYVYQKEGILAAMAAHGFFNGMLAVSIVAAAAGVPWLALATAPAALYFANRARKVLKAQKPEIASGALAPKPMSALMAVSFAAILMAGYFLIMPNIFWPIGAAALVIAAARKLKNKS